MSPILARSVASWLIRQPRASYLLVFDIRNLMKKPGFDPTSKFVALG